MITTSHSKGEIHHDSSVEWQTYMIGRWLIPCFSVSIVVTLIQKRFLFGNQQVFFIDSIPYFNHHFIIFCINQF
jgi:hypothetical protein